MLNEWPDRNPEPPSRWPYIIGAIVLLGTAAFLAQLLLFLFVD